MTDVIVHARCKGLFYIVEHKSDDDEPLLSVFVKATQTLAKGVPFKKSSAFVKNIKTVLFNGENIGLQIEPELDSIEDEKQNRTFAEFILEKKSIHRLHDFIVTVRKGRLQYNDIVNMIRGIQKQIETIYSRSKTIAHINIDNIYVINETYYVYTGFETMESFIPKEKRFILTHPVDTTAFNSVICAGRDDNGVTKLPHDIWIESFGRIMLYGLTGTQTIPQTPVALEEVLEPIFATPLYYCIKRAIQEQKLILL